MNNLHFLTLADAGRLIAARKLSPVEYTEHQLARIAALDPQLNAFITVTAGLARAQAKQAEAELMAGRARGPLHGIPMALKDIYNTRGILTSGGSKIGLGHVPDHDAAGTRRLADAGMVLLGKLQTHEFAHGGPSVDLPWPPSRNPWHLEHFTGGSSSGSGAAIAAGLVPASLGSDTGGSIRGPASFCGFAGLMPTSGLVSRAGVIPNSFTFDHCGPMAWTVEDCALLLQAIAGFDPADGGSIQADIPDYRAALTGNIRGLKVGVLRHYWEEDLPAHPEHRQAMDAALDVLRTLGARVEDCRTRPLTDSFDTKVVIAETEIFSVHADNLRARPADFGRDFLGRILPACLFTSADYFAATREHRRIVTEMQPLYAKYDVLVTAGFGPAPRLDAHRTINFWQRSNVFTPSNVTGGPALELCNGFSQAGLPLGLQVIGRPFGEATVLRVGDAYERATAWRERRPELKAGPPLPPVSAQVNEPVVPDLDAETLGYINTMVKRAGLTLDDRRMAILLEAAPHALAMATRLRKKRGWFEEPSLVFRFRDH